MSHAINLHDATGVILRINGDVADVYSTDAPTASAGGYAEGCTYRYAAGASSKLYINTGSNTSATWTVVGAQS